jgi:hypothetical protein
VHDVQALDSSLQQYPQDDERVAVVSTHSALLLASLQEATLPWWKGRSSFTILTYEKMLNSAWECLATEQFSQERLIALARRAILHRERRRDDLCAFYLADLDRHLHDTTNPFCRVAYYCQKAYSLVLEGKEKEWSHAIERIRSIGHAMRVDAQGQLRIAAIIDCVEMSAYKRFAWELRHEKCSPQRELYAEKGFVLSANLQQMPYGAQALHDLNFYYVGASLSQANITLMLANIELSMWLDPHLALYTGTKIESQIAALFPSCLNKFQGTLAMAHKCLRSTNKA